MKIFAMLTLSAAVATSGCMGATTGAGPAPGIPTPFEPSSAVDPFPDFGIAVNAYRAPGLNPLAFNAKLHAAAQAHATDMYDNGFFSHTGSDGSLPWDRANAAGYDYAWIGENIARGQADADAALTAWQNSPGHNAILLSSEPTEFALAWEKGNHWVMVLARPK